jgi:hypothetical protein
VHTAKAREAASSGFLLYTDPSSSRRSVGDYEN